MSTSACPHVISLTDVTVRCAIMPQITMMIGEQSPASPCLACKAHWRDGQPPNLPAENEALMAIVSRMPVDPSGTAAIPPTVPPPVSREPYPTLPEMVKNFAGAVGRMLKAKWHGQEVLVSQDRFEAVLACCDQCIHWDGTARLGLGKCTATGCGCTQLKLHLATEACPLGGWDNTDLTKPIVCPAPREAKEDT